MNKIMGWLAYNFGTLFVKVQWHSDGISHDIIVGELFLGKPYIREVERKLIGGGDE